MLIAVFVATVPAGAADTQPAGTPPAVGLDAAARAGGELPRLHSLLVSWRGNLILERYYNGARASQPANIKSASKSVISALVGIAIDRRLIAGVTQPIASFFSELDTSKRQITVEDLLTMRSGLEPTSNINYGAWVQSPDWVDVSFVARTQSRWSDQLYGYGWWVRELAGHDAYFAWGYGGQYAFVVPGLDLVIVTTSSIAVSDLTRERRHTIIDLVERFIVEPIAAVN